MTYRLSLFGAKFPFPRTAGPDLAQLYLLVRTVAPQLPYGWNAASYGATATFLDNVGKQVRCGAVCAVLCGRKLSSSLTVRAPETSEGDQHAVRAGLGSLDRHLLLR